MSSRSRTFSWTSAQRDLRDDRMVVARPVGNWQARPSMGPGGQALRDEAGDIVGMIRFDHGRCYAGVFYDARLSTKPTILSLTYDMSPIGVRAAKLAVEKALADAAALQAEAA
jgi:hypothetical protein